MGLDIIGPAHYLDTRLGSVDTATGQITVDSMDDFVVVFEGNDGNDYLLVAENPASSDDIAPSLRVVDRVAHGGRLYLDRLIDLNADGRADNPLYSGENSNAVTYTSSLERNTAGHWQLSIAPLHGTVGTLEDSDISSGLPSGNRPCSQDNLMQTAIDIMAHHIPDLSVPDAQALACTSENTAISEDDGNQTTTQTLHIFEPYTATRVDGRGQEFTIRTDHVQGQRTDYVIAEMVIAADMLPTAAPMTLHFEPQAAPQPPAPRQPQQGNWWQRLWKKD